MTPYQLFFEGTHFIHNESNSDTNLTSPSVHPPAFDPESLSSEHVDVPRILFSPCTGLGPVVEQN